MNRNEKLKKAYRDLQLQNAPDLWERISRSLADKEAAAEESSVTICDEPKAKRIRFRLQTGVAAACCVIAAAGSLTAWRLWNPGGDMPKAENAVKQQITTDAAAGAAGDATAGATGDVTAGAAKQEGGAAEEGEGTAVRRERPADAAEDAAAEAVKAPGAAEQQAKAGGIVYYGSLPLSGATVPAPAQNTVYIPGDHYFTEETMRDASLLSQAAVTKVSYGAEADGKIRYAVYEMVIEHVLYAEDYVSFGQKIQVKSPLIEGGPENGALYGLKEGGTYILPLKYEAGSYWLVCPYAPQIEVTEDMGYVFHNGWQSLVDDETSVVLMDSAAPEDFYYDRMMMREDPDFLSELTQLVKEARKSGRKA